MSDRTALAIDAGQTGVRAQLSIDGVLEQFHFDGIRTDTDLIPQLADVAAAVSRSTGFPIHTLSAGVSGLVGKPGQAHELAEAGRSFGLSEVHLAHDSISSYLGALGDERGVVVAAGTGVVTLAVGASTVARIDGWGYLIGDAGSGFWIGRAALDAVMRAHDGRAPTTALSAVVTHDFPDLEHAYIELQADPGRVRRIAAYAHIVADLAATDVVAAGITRAAASELAHSAATGLRRVGEESQVSPVVCALGGVLRAIDTLSSFESDLRAIWPKVELRTPIGTSLDGAALLPTLTGTSALKSHVLSWTEA